MSLRNGRRWERGIRIPDGGEAGVNDVVAWMVNIGQLVTLAGPARGLAIRGAELRELGVIADAALIVWNGRIAAAGELCRVCARTFRRKGHGD